MFSFALLALPALAIAQTFDFNVIGAQPAPVLATAPVGGDSDSPAIQPLSLIPSIAAYVINSSPIAQRDVAAENIFKRDGTCASQGDGTGPAVRNPDTPQNFIKYFPFVSSSYSAPIPTGYQVNFTNLQASTSTSSYLGYTTLDSYDTRQCAANCNGITGCVAFNLYYERDPSLDPNTVSCPNPPSITNIKCVYWGVPVSKATATNAGQYRASFQVVITGSNGYNKISFPPVVSGFTIGAAVQGQLAVPNDLAGGYSTYIGAKFFSFGTVSPNTQTQYFSTEICVHACRDQTIYNYANPPALGNPKVCNQVVGHSLSKNGVPYGMYCAFYTESWDYSYGTTSFVVSGGDSWAVGNAYSYTNATYAAKYQNISPKGYQGGNCGGWGAGSC